MESAGIDVQVLSLTAPVVQNLAPADAMALQNASNNRLAETVRADPDRLQGLAMLATAAPGAAARELERAVTTLGLNGAMLFGRTRERNLDRLDFWPIFEAAAALNAPLSPQSASTGRAGRPLQRHGRPGQFGLRYHGIGWYYETGIQLLRLILGEVFDRFPGLQVIVGHRGELVLFHLDHLDGFAKEAKLPRPFSEYLRGNVFVTPSGLLSQRCLRWAIEVIGVERILVSTDYLFVPVPDGAAPAFLEAADPTDAGRERIASGNWNRLCAGIQS